DGLALQEVSVGIQHAVLGHPGRGDEDVALLGDPTAAFGPRAVDRLAVDQLRRAVREELFRRGIRDAVRGYVVLVLIQRAVQRNPTAVGGRIAEKDLVAE